VGWVLRELGRPDEDRVVGFVEAPGGGLGRAEKSAKWPFRRSAMHEAVRRLRLSIVTKGIGVRAQRFEESAPFFLREP
jgi:hypothetical protein